MPRQEEREPLLSAMRKPYLSKRPADEFLIVLFQQADNIIWYSLAGINRAGEPIWSRRTICFYDVA